MPHTHLQHQWPHRWYGFWSDPDNIIEELPTLKMMTDPSWSPQDLYLLAAYLDTGHVKGVITTPPSLCSICSERVLEAVFCWDGEWVWPKSLSHYIRHHNIVLPDTFIEHIRANQYDPLCKDVSSKEFWELPWPTAYTVLRQLGKPISE